MLYEGGQLEVSGNFKQQGNEAVQMASRRTNVDLKYKAWTDAIQFYSNGIVALLLGSENEKGLVDAKGNWQIPNVEYKELIVSLYSNRSHVQLLLKNYRSAIQDARQAIRLAGLYPEYKLEKLNTILIKCHFRSAKAFSELKKYHNEAKIHVQQGLSLDPNNVELTQLWDSLCQKQVDYNFV